jgi:hypothetical protein
MAFDMSVRMMPDASFEAPYNWCDSNCRRCSLHHVCKVALTNECRRWRREDPDALPCVLEDVSADLHEAGDMLLQAAHDRGIDLNAPMLRCPTVRSDERLKHASLKLTRCVFVLEVTGGLDREGAAECLRLCLLLSGKIARVTSYLAFELSEVWASDGQPNLLLIELTLRRLRKVLDPLRDRQTSSALQQLDQLLAPLFATVDDAARARLLELVLSGQAPSPFLVTTGGCGAMSSI